MMNARTLPAARVGWLTLVVALGFAPTSVRAEVTRIEIASRADVIGGKSFGTVGAYEKLVGEVFFALDPQNPHNKTIVDLEKAPRNAQGKVEFSCDLVILKPKDPARGNGVLFLDVVNRGTLRLPYGFQNGQMSADPTTEAQIGDG